MKICISCNAELPESSFYAAKGMKDGLCGRCKECQKSLARSGYAAGRQARHEYEKKRNATAARKAQLAASQKRQRESSPEKYIARTAVGNAIRDGKLVRLPCESCGSKAEAHHEDYDLPLEVRWLCFSCHRKEHGQNPGPF